MTTETAVRDQKELFEIGAMNPGASESNTMDVSLPTGSNAPELGSLLNFSSRLRSSSTEGDFQTQTLIVGEEVGRGPDPEPDEDVISQDRFEQP